jgi:hypothetical protein
LLGIPPSPGESAGLSFDGASLSLDGLAPFPEVASALLMALTSLLAASMSSASPSSDSPQAAPNPSAAMAVNV